MEEQKLDFGIKNFETFEGTGSIGIAITYGAGEFYIYISLFKWAVAIGRMYMPI